MRDIGWQMIVIALDQQTQREITRAMREDARLDFQHHKRVDYTPRALPLPHPVAVRLHVQEGVPIQ